MLLFQKKFLAGLENGSISLTFRRWPKARVKAGGRYRCHPIGVLEVDDVRRVQTKDIDEEDAQRAGFESLGALIEYLGGGPAGNLTPSSEVFRVELHHAGDGDRVAIALDDALAPADIDVIRKKLARLDRDRPWTLETLRLIERRPRVRAVELARELGRERDPFKEDVRKLKRLGLTQSFEIGYEVSPRGQAYLRALAIAADQTAKD